MLESAPAVPVLPGTPAASAAERIVFTLVRPALSENIGAALRALTNFGFANLRVAAMPGPFDAEKAGALAVCAKTRLHTIQFSPTLDAAVGDCVRVYAITRRRRKHRYAYLSTRAGAERIWQATARGRVGVIFGCEAHGLDNLELNYAQELVAIPTADEMGSLNLAQAVLIIAYELYLAQANAPAYLLDRRFPPATQHDIERMLQHMERALWAIGYIREVNPEIIGELRQVFGTRELTLPWVRILRGIFTRMEQCAVNVSRAGGDPRAAIGESKGNTSD